MLIDGAVGLLIFLWIYFIVQDYPDETVHLPQSSERPNFLKALSNRQNWLAGLYTSCLNLPIMVLCALWGASYLKIVHHLPEMAASNVVSLILVGSIIGCPLVGWFSDKLGRRKPLMIAGAVATILIVMPFLSGAVLSKTTLSVLFFALGVVTSTQVISYPMVAESNHRGNTGAATGVASIIIMGGGGVAQVLFGSLMQHHAANSTIYTVADYQFALWMFPIATIVALLAVMMTKETHCKRV